VFPLSLNSRPARAFAFLLFCALALGVAAYLHLSLPNIPDRDALYHYRHAALYRERGPLMRDFPWTAFSVISTLKSDIWYGFHLFLLPFTLSADPVRGVKLAGVGDLFALLLLSYLAMRCARLRLSFLWPFLLISFAPYLLYRLVMTRPHVISMGLAALLLSCTISGGIWAVALVSFLLTFVHLGLFWIIPLILGVVAFVVRLTEERWLWRETLAALAGGALGWLLRPNPLGAAKLVYIQIVQLALEKQKGVPLLFGADLVSGFKAIEIHQGGFLQHFAPATLVWLAGVIALFAAVGHQAKLTPNQRTFLWSTLALSALTFAIMMQFSLRAVDLWAVFAIAFVASVFSFILRPGAAARTGFSTPSQLRLITLLGALLVGFIFFRAFDEHSTRMKKLGYSPYRFKAAAQYLQQHSNPGDIVFHAHWDLFPDLFFWNTYNHYIGGMDPIFQYAYSPSLYWEAHHLWTGQYSSYTCPTVYCTPAQGEDTFTVLTRDFRARFLVLEPKRHPALYAYASKDTRFRKVLADEEVAVFDLIPAR
jgi:hypothetical protein